MSETVTPRLSRGLRDLFPQQMLARQQMIDTIRQVYQLYGFVPLETPAIEYGDVLTGSEAGVEATQSIYRVQGPEFENLGLRFDLTVPLARVVSQYSELPSPFRRYQISPVWRTDKPGPGRFREFTQFDLDSVGVESEIGDTEIIAGMCDTLSALKVGPYQVKFSSRAILNLLLNYAGIPEQRGIDVFRVLDKREKIGPKKMRAELTTGYTDESGDEIRGLGLTDRQVEKIERFLQISAADRREVLAKLRETFSDIDEANKTIDVVQRISDHLFALGYGNDRVVLDLSIARGLAYYTGPVFEATLSDAPKFGSVFAGGRYDDLVMRFSGQKVPATGASIGVDRLLAVLDALGRLKQRKSTAKVLVLSFDPKLISDYLAITFQLRRSGIPAELYMGGERQIGRQLRYADACEIPISLLYGDNEKTKGVVTLKDMEVGRHKTAEMSDREEWLKARPGQREISLSGLIAGVSGMLSQIEGNEHER